MHACIASGLLLVFVVLSILSLRVSYPANECVAVLVQRLATYPPCPLWWMRISCGLLGLPCYGDFILLCFYK